MTPTGLLSRPSSHNVAETAHRLRQAVAARGLSLFATVDHAAGAASVGLALAPMTVLMFGHPRGGTPLMQAAPTMGLDLPLRMLVWQDAAGDTQLIYDDIGWLAARHGVPPDHPAIAALATLLATLAGQAADASALSPAAGDNILSTNDRSAAT